LKKVFLILVVFCITLVGITAFDPPPLPVEENIPPDPPNNQVEEKIPWYDKKLMPDFYVVYTDGTSMVVNHEYPGLKKVILPINNSYKQAPGCYIACYSKEKEGAIYPVGGGIFVMGQVRVPGSYQSRICRPKGYETADISAEDYFKKLCRKSLPNCKTDTSCWAGGDTAWCF
jgi:hypothetical protein